MKLDEYVRVLKLTRKPKKEEFIMVAKVTGIGIIVIGLIGTIITIAASAIGISG